MARKCLPDGYSWTVDGEDAQTTEIYVENAEGELIGKDHVASQFVRTDAEREEVAAQIAAGERGRQFQ